MKTIKKACKGVSYPKSSNVSSRLGSPGKAKTGKLVPSKSSVSKRMSNLNKAKSGTSFGMLSVKAGIDKNPNPTAADRIAGAKMNAGKAKSGKMLKKQAATAIAMKKAGKMPKAMMKSGGKMKKCAYGCK